MPSAVQPERILKDLAKLWIDLGKEDHQKGSAGVLRACAMTLIAAVEEEGDAQAVGRNHRRNHASAPQPRDRHAGGWRRAGRSRCAGIRAMLDAVWPAPADLLRGDRDHRFAVASRRSAQAGAGNHGAGSACCPVVPRRASVPRSGFSEPVSARGQDQ